MLHRLSPDSALYDPAGEIEAGDDLDRLVRMLTEAFASPTLTRGQAQRLAALAEQAAWTIRRRREAVSMARMRHALEMQADQILDLRLKLSRERRALRSTLTVARAGIWECRLDDERLDWSDGVYDLFGVRKGRTVYRPDVIGLFAHASLARLDEVRSKAISGGGAFRLDTEIRTEQGERRWIRISAAVERRAGLPVRLYGLKQDVTEETALAREAARLADVDALTGLGNRRVFQRRIAELAPQPESLLILIDLDGFKPINDAFGHLVGDSVLKAAADRLRVAGRGAALLARIGGDEFALAFEDGLEPSEAARHARRVVEALRMPVERGGLMLELRASAGLAWSNGASPEDWTARADRALYAAKASGRGEFRHDDAADFARVDASLGREEGGTPAASVARA